MTANIDIAKSRNIGQGLDMAKCKEDKLNEDYDSPASTAAEAPPAR